MPKVKVSDINIYYEIHGKGEPLVMINGASGSVEWLYQAIPVYSREYRLIVFDNRGAGRSDAPDIPYTTEMMADDAAGLLDAIGIDSAHIWSGSMGGMIAQQFVLRYPKRVRSLILACTYCGGPNSSIMTDPETMRAIEHMQGLSGKELMMETLRLCLSQKFINDNPGTIKEMIKNMMKHSITSHGQMRQGQAVMGHNTYERLPEIKAPTLVISGDADKLIPVENSRIIASRIPGAELIILKNMGHLFGFEAVDESNRVMLDFLRRHRSSGKKG
jgi:pimeloyl-ACP methyl ester carboxylesterase